MIITCPHCQTKYRVTYEAIGSAGRKVQCANCHQAWQQAPVEEPVIDAVLDDISEDALDEALETEAQHATHRPGDVHEREETGGTAVAAVPNTADAAMLSRQQRAFSRRQNALAARLPLARFRRVARTLAVVLACALVAGLYFGRVEVVKRYPDLAGVYQSVGLPVNVIGLDFSQLRALRSLRDGKDVLVVSAQLVGLMPNPVSVPPVVVTLLDEAGSALYEWSLAPSARDLMAGERASFETQLNTPPEEARRVRLSFAGHSLPAEDRPTDAQFQSGNGEAQTPPSPAAQDHSDPEHH